MRLADELMEATHSCSVSVAAIVAVEAIAQLLCEKGILTKEEVDVRGRAIIKEMLSEQAKP